MRQHPRIGTALEGRAEGPIARPMSGVPVPSTPPSAAPRPLLILTTTVCFPVRPQLLTRV
jgi:hypothetical protein